MRALKVAALAGATMMLGFAMAGSNAQNAPAPTAPAGRGAFTPPVVKYSWAAKPIKPPGWQGVNKPVWRIAEIVAAHKGQPRWSQEIVRDEDYSGKWTQMAAGDRIAPQFWADDRIMWIVYSGQMRVSIEGRDPFVAGPGFLVQVPYRNVYSVEVVGNEPVVRFEVIRPGRNPMIPATLPGTDKPADIAGFRYEKISYNVRPDGFEGRTSRPFLDFNGEIVQGGGRGGAFVYDTTNFMNVIRGRGMPTPPDTNKGHWHTDYGEFWYIAEGTIDYKMEGMPVFTAGIGDVVYAPKGQWHRASASGTGMATRIAINPRPEGMHNFDGNANARQ